MKEAKDNFSQQAQDYAKFRPTYPKEIYEYILALTPERSKAWDCATGNGQVAVELAKNFEEVIATDISKKQLDQAPELPNISYQIQRAEKTSFPDQSFDLITVAQAIHWFDFGNFFKEAERLLCPAGLLGIWGYELVRLRPEIDEVMDHFYHRTVGKYWDPERRHIDTKYEDIPFPNWEFQERPSFSIQEKWNVEKLAGYISTWSAVRKYRSMKKSDPIPELYRALKEVWPEKEAKVGASIELICWFGKKDLSGLKT